MAVWKCMKCGFKKETRCKPRKCPECNVKDGFANVADGTSGETD